MLIKPIMTYNSEVTYLDSYISFFRAKQRATNSNKEVDKFGFIDKSPIENLHLSFCKFILGARKNATNLGTRIELGRLPIEHFIQTQTLLYLSRLSTLNLNPLLKESFLLTKELDSLGTYTWFTYAKNIALDANVDLDRLLQFTNIKQTNSIKSYLKSKIKKYFEKRLRNKQSAIDEKSKLFLYKSLKQDLNIEKYLAISNFEYRRLITKLRISDHSLLIEKGRQFKISREDRLCKTCNKIEDEQHFLLDCKTNSQIRTAYISFLIDQFPKFHSLSCIEKMRYILNPSTPIQVNKLGSFIKKSLELRSGDS